MNEKLKTRLRGEGGASLVLALAFLTLFSVIAVSILSLSGVSVRNTTVTRSRVDQLYSADGGVEWGVRRLVDQNVCKDVSSSFATIPNAPAVPTVNGTAPAVECKTTVVDSTTTTTTTTGSGLTSIMNGWAVVIRGTGGIVVGGNANNAPTHVVQGNVYTRGTITAPSGSKVRVEGNLRVGTGSCPPANVTKTGTCSVSTTIPSPVPNPPKVVVPASTTSAPSPQLWTATCTILYPGRYSSPVNLSSSMSYYMASGTYYFVNTGDINVTGTIFGGAPGTDAKQITGASACATDANAQSKVGSSVYNASTAGSGVNLVLGGNAGIRVQSNARLELYQRKPVTGSPDCPTTSNCTTTGLGIWARSTTSGSTGGYTTSSNSVPFRTQEKSSTVVVHGTTYLPEREVNIREPLNPGAPGSSMFMGGLIASKLVFDLQGNGSSSDLSQVAGGGVVTTTTTVTTPKTTVLQSTAGNTVVTAIIDRPTSGITSWRRA